MAKVGKALGDGKWMSSASKRPGALRDTAANEGKITEQGTINKEWIAKKARGKGKTAARARLAQKYAKYRPGKRRK